MKIIGVSNLKAHLSEILHLVESGEVFEVTRQGRSVARIVPLLLSRKPTPQEIAEAIESVDLLAEEIGKYVPAGVTAEQIINDIRR